MKELVAEIMLRSDRLGVKACRLWVAGMNSAVGTFKVPVRNGELGNGEFCSGTTKVKSGGVCGVGAEEQQR